MQTVQFYRDKHIKYFNRCLGVLPSKYESEDSNKLALIYFSLAGLDLLGGLEQIPQTTRDEYKEWVYMHYISTKEGFRGSAIYDLHDHGQNANNIRGGDSDVDDDNSYDKPNLAATCFALQILIILKDENLVERIDRYKILNYLAKCQLDDGSFAPGLDIDGYPFGENDLRYCMIGATVRFLLGFSNGVKPHDDYQDINVLKFQEYIKSIQSYDGGFGIFKMSESHAGICFCGLSALVLSDYNDNSNHNTEEKLIEKVDGEKLTRFLVFRQVSSDDDNDGGFNGRLNKDSDTCYCFWVTSSLFLIKRQNLIDFDQLSKFLINHTQNKIMGGFNKSTDPDDTPDPLHSFLGLAALSLISNDESNNGGKNPFLSGLNLNLKKIDPKVVISKESYDFGINLKWK